MCVLVLAQGPTLWEASVCWGLQKLGATSPAWVLLVASCLIGPPTLFQFHKDVKDAQELLGKVDSDLDQKYSPDFKDRYQIELLLRELDVSDSLAGPLPLGPWPGGLTTPASLGPHRTKRRPLTSMRTWCGGCRSEGSR